MTQFEIRWHGHACFSVQCGDYTVLFDPYENDYVRGFGSLDVAADRVLCSHEQHADHNARQVVRPLTGHEDPFTLTTIETFHDPEQGALRGPNTIHILQAGKLKVAHLGDLGCELTPAQVAALQGLDVVMIPVGGYYTIGPAEAKTLLDQLQAKVVIPMHYRQGHLGLPNVAELDDFLALVGDYVYYPGNSITINEGTKPQVAVLKFMGQGN